MTEQITTAAMSAPDKNGKPALPKRGGAKGLLPSTWLDRTLRIAYVDCYGGGQETSGVLLDFFPAGPVFNIAGGKIFISWDALTLVED